LISGGLGVLAALRDLFFFFSQSLPAVGRIQSRKEIVVHSYPPRRTDFYFSFTKSPLITVENRAFFLKK
jgi:hypothetical protein